MASRARAPLKIAPPAPLLYTGQDVARFCEVDLKTIHHWAERGKIPHHRTEGRHLRFRRNDVLRFLRAHAYPVPDELTAVRASLAIAPPAGPDAAAGWPFGFDDLAKRLATRFAVRRHANVVVSLARAFAEGADAILLPVADPALGGARTIAALKAAPETAWIVVVALADGPAADEARAAGAELVLSSRELSSLGSQLAKVLAVA